MTAALWVGDSFTAGEGALVPAALTYPHLESSRLGWACHVDAQNGTGFVSDGHPASPDCAPLIHRLPDDVRRYTADVVIVDAGRNDVDASIPRLQAAILEYLTAVRTAYPAAPVGDRGAVADRAGAAAGLPPDRGRPA
jgi:hypothetical protein